MALSQQCDDDASRQARSQFSKIASKTNQRWVITYDKPLIHFGTDILKIVAVLVLFDTS